MFDLVCEIIKKFLQDQQSSDLDKQNEANMAFQNVNTGTINNLPVGTAITRTAFSATAFDTFISAVVGTVTGFYSKSGQIASISVTAFTTTIPLSDNTSYISTNFQIPAEITPATPGPGPAAVAVSSSMTFTEPLGASVITGEMCVENFGVPQFLTFHGQRVDFGFNDTTTTITVFGSSMAYVTLV